MRLLRFVFFCFLLLCVCFSQTDAACLRHCSDELCQFLAQLGVHPVLSGILLLHGLRKPLLCSIDLLGLELELLLKQLSVGSKLFNQLLIIV